MNFFFDDCYQKKENISDEFSLKVVERNKNFIFPLFHCILSKEKEKIDVLENSEDWDKMKKIGNPFELIYTTYNKKKKNESISQYIPISRSYFKMLEMFYNFDFFSRFNPNEKMIFSHLAEGPGGFLEATYQYRMKKTNCKMGSHKDKFYGITLKPTNEYIPDWNKVRKIFATDSNIVIDYGNLYIMNDVCNYLKHFQGQKAHLVTSDGGFDYSTNFNGQEINSCQIIFSEIVVSLLALRKNGCFIVKVFDLFSITMLQLLYILYSNFERVYIYKPETSRPANSEKYVVCMYYKDECSDKLKEKFLHMIKEWNELKVEENDIRSVMFSDIKVDNGFIQLLNDYNKKYIDNQIFFLQNTIELAQKKPSKEEYNKIIQNQVGKATNWCKKYNVEINKDSIYLKKNVNYP